MCQARCVNVKLNDRFQLLERRGIVPRISVAEAVQLPHRLKQDAALESGLKIVDGAVRGMRLSMVRCVACARSKDLDVNEGGLAIVDQSFLQHLEAVTIVKALDVIQKIGTGGWKRTKCRTYFYDSEEQTTSIFGVLRAEE